MQVCPFEGHVLVEVTSFVLEMKSQCYFTAHLRGVKQGRLRQIKTKGPGKNSAFK